MLQTATVRVPLAKRKVAGYRRDPEPFKRGPEPTLARRSRVLSGPSRQVCRKGFAANDSRDRNVYVSIQ